MVFFIIILNVQLLTQLLQLDAHLKVKRKLRSLYVYKNRGGGSAENVIKAGTSNQLLYNDKEVILKENFLNLVYPVGSIYLSSKNTNPGTLFGGTWTQIKDKFILTAGDSYTNGATGGAATVTLTVSNMPSHSHSFTPSGTVSSHTHTGPSHSHSFTPSGNVSSHSHSFTPSGTVSSSFSGTAGTTGNQSANPTFSGSHTHSHTCISGSSYLTYYQDQQNGVVGNNNNQTNGQTNDTGYVTTDEKTVTISGTTSGNHTHSFTPSGTASSSFSGTAGYTGETAPSFTGTAGNTGAAGTGNTGETAPSFTGTAGNTGSSGSGSSFSILPPYVVKYCWERTA